MPSTETGPSEATRRPNSQHWLLFIALGLLVIAGAWGASQRDTWKEMFRDWSVDAPNVEDLDRVVSGLDTGVIPGIEAGEVRTSASLSPLAPGAITSDWTQLLGPNNDGTSPETFIEKDFSDGGPQLLWTRNSGPTYATPAIIGDRLIHFYRYGDEEIVACLNAETGDELWSFSYPTTYADNFKYGGGPKCAPIIEGDRVYTYGVQGRLHCLELETGKVLWDHNPVEEYKLSQNFFGVGDAPLIEGDLLIVTVGAPQGPCVAAYNKFTGEMVWAVGDEWRAGYSSPVAATVHGQRRVFAFVGGDSDPPTGGLMVVDPVEGKEVFRFPWRSRIYESISASSPVVVGNEVFITASYGVGGALLEIKPDGSFEQRWTTRDLAPHWMTPVYKDGYLYGFDGRFENNATVVCLEWATGKVMWRKLIGWKEEYFHAGITQEKKYSPGRASLLSIDGHFLCLGEGGHLLWLDLTPEECTVMSRAWLVRSKNIWGMPVVSHGLLYINQTEQTLERDPPRLLCYDLRTQSGS